MAVRSGNLEPLKLFKIFRSMLDRQMNGLLTLERGNVRKKAHIVSGSPVRVGSNLEAENLLHALVHDGLISSTEKIDVEGELRQKKEALDAILIRRRLVSQARLQNVERRLGKNRLLDTFGWPDGRFTFEEMELKHDAAIPGIDVVLLLVEAAARALPDGECTRFANAYVDHAVHPTQVLSSYHDGFDRIFPGENVASHLAAPIEVRELAARLGDPRATARQICAVVLAGLGNFRVGTEPEPLVSIPPGSVPVHAAVANEPTPLSSPGSGYDRPPPGYLPPPPMNSASPDLVPPPPLVSGPPDLIPPPSEPAAAVAAPSDPAGALPPPPPGGGASLPPPPGPGSPLAPPPGPGPSVPPPPAPTSGAVPPPPPTWAAAPPPPPSMPPQSTAPPTSAPVGRKELRIGLGPSRRAVRPPSVTHRAERVASRPAPASAPVSAPRGRGASAPPASVPPPAVAPTASVSPPAVAPPTPPAPRRTAASAPPPAAPTASARPAAPKAPLRGVSVAPEPEPPPDDEVVPGSQPLTGFGQKPASKAPAPVAPMRGSARKAQPAKTKEMPAKVRAKLDEAKRIAGELNPDKPDHFAVLGVERDDHEQTVRTAFRRLARDFHVDKFTRFGLEKEETAIVQKVFIAINRAHEVLTDPEERAEYLAEIDLQAAGLKSVRPGDHMDNALRGEKLREDGLTAIKNAKADLAIDLLTQALEIDAGDRLAQAGKAYADYMVVQARGSSPQVLARTREVLEKITDDGIEREEPWLYLGRVYRAGEDLRRAVTALERAVDINRHCAEAQSELRHVRRKLQGPQQKKGGLFGRRKK